MGKSVDDFMNDSFMLDNQVKEQPTRDIMHDREGFRKAEEAELDPVVDNGSTTDEGRRLAALQIVASVMGTGGSPDLLLTRATKVEAWLRGDTVPPSAAATLALGTGGGVTPEALSGALDVPQGHLTP